jgi:hypothetical protein
MASEPIKLTAREKRIVVTALGALASAARHSAYFWRGEMDRLKVPALIEYAKEKDREAADCERLIKLFEPIPRKAKE